MTEKRLSHAYMLIGPEGPERDRAATELAAAMLCAGAGAPCGQCRDCRKVFAGVHPDVISVERQADGKGQLHREILVDQIRQAAADAAIAPNEAARKVYVIRQADRLNLQAQNALLKALEEPPGHACFILCAAAADALLPTVRSRCVRMAAGEGRQPEALSDLARGFLNAAAAGDPADMTMFCMLRAKLTREEAESFFDEVDGALCDILCARRDDPGLGRERIFKLSALMERAKDYLRHNVSPKQVFGVLAVEALR